MDSGDPGRLRAWCSLWLCLVLLWPASGLAQALQIDRLPADPPAGEVLSGIHDARLEPQAASDLLFEIERQPRWWRLTPRERIPADDAPQLVLESPYSTRLEAWLPGSDAPTLHMLFGEGRDDRYASRALVIALPGGLSPGEAVWLRVDARAGYPMGVSVASRDQVHRADLAYVAWRATILTALCVLALLAIGFWVGTGDRSYGYLSGTLLFSAGYVAAVGGELRWIPGFEPLLAESPQVSRMFAFLGTISSNLFQQRYLDMPRRLPWSSRVLHMVTLIMLAMILATLFSAAPAIADIGNLLLIVSALVIITASARLAWRGERPAILLFCSWLPLMLFVILRAGESSGFWQGPSWLGHGLAASFALAGLLVTLGLSDKLLELRRDRDLASARADIDDLTAIASRPAIDRMLRDAVAAAHAVAGRRLCVAFIDIDHFKQVNDRYGHRIGDDCLREICRRIHGWLDPGDCLGRYGGDELLLVMPGRGLDEAVQLAEDIRTSVNEKPIAVGEERIECTLSVGVAELRLGENVERLLVRADAALYVGKNDGRNRVSRGRDSGDNEAEWESA